ncbi:P-loop containing nucleoside triphosphate hydrolase protein [Roridomyces roridus]|uniref:vesicle-fusing ATPase n=1 Tax=Roridomyces roridus TaxID=1738132 RepID=A0AAD7BT28_9AGAR|nr:P-loop containing nucleoside triphosphate hydrolase protein [Roridomyces roridus]
MSRQDSLNKAIEIVQKAIEYDRSQNHSQACKDYMNALDYFMLALKNEKNEQFKQLIRSKIDDYLTRAETLQKHLATSTPTNTTQPKHATADSEDPDTKKLRAGLSEAILSAASSNVTWDDIAGLDAAKNALKEAVIFPLKFPQFFQGQRRAWKGILLYGPPGTGKSYLAKAVVNEAKTTFFSISSSDLVSKWQGESEKLVKHLFQMAREMRPAIIFIDEIDSLTGARGDGDSDASRRLKTEFLVQMDGVGRDDSGVLVIGATNIPWQIDLSIKRRFQKRIYIPLPDADARRQMFELHVGNTPCELTSEDYRMLAERTEGYSGADISIVVQDALMQPIRKLISATHFKSMLNSDSDTEVKWTPCPPDDIDAIPKTWSDIASHELFEPMLTLKDFTDTLENVKPSVVAKDLERHVEWTKEFGINGS